MFDRLEAMAMLSETVKRGSMSAAARAMGVPLPTLSRKLGELEAAVGARLLLRTTRALSLTEAGEGYLAAARRILDQVRDAEREAAGGATEASGELVITAPVLFGRLHVLPLVTEFLAAHPRVDARLLLLDHNTHLVEEGIDVAFRIGALTSAELISTRLGAMRTVVCASPALLAERGVPATPGDLGAWPAITVESPFPSPTWRFASDGRPDRAIGPARARLRVTGVEAAVEAAKAGVGVVQLLHYQVAAALAEGSLQLLLADHEPEPAPVHAVHVARGRMPLKLRRFLDLSTPRLRRSLAAPSLRP